MGDYAGRPEAGWRQAAGSVEKIAAKKEGPPAPDFDFRGRVVRVADGDTVSILGSDNKQHRVRLYGIDTPEQDQPHGASSKQALSDLLADQVVDVVVVETDSYGRTVATLYRDGNNINKAMVAGGNAWWYRHFAPHSRELQNAEQTARQREAGLWRAAQPIPPWEWRRGQR